MAADTERETMSSRRQEHRYDSAMTLTRTSSDRQRDKPRRSHRNAPNSSVSRSSNKAKTRPMSSRYITQFQRDDSSGSTDKDIDVHYRIRAETLRAHRQERRK